MRFLRVNYLPTTIRSLSVLAAIDPIVYCVRERGSTSCGEGEGVEEGRVLERGTVLVWTCSKDSICARVRVYDGSPTVCPGASLTEGAPIPSTAFMVVAVACLMAVARRWRRA